ncbi:phage integrase SAM-like domain-containing protein [Chryseobacterium potabilaquae]|uniref:Tyrosine recombinase XerD n=1 Tax=Chryseobacterium potabilaquae TaxID=2675057 RepID=A0A6N4XB81_9FLAO|nr:phage integrase SAM-like domain-containing protein [Chryseobacterium potabilaquae]CAA7196676.1 Tyrosine recombinase XerD [Chryseobacterium potabilaquae]
MTFEFFLPQKGTLKNIHLNITDASLQDHFFSFRTSLRIEPHQWDKNKQRPVNIYLKKYKKLNTILDHIKVRVSEYIKERLQQRKTISQRGLSTEIHKICIEKIQSYHENSLLYYMKHYIKSRKEMICQSTYKRYLVFYRLIKRFEGFLMERLNVENINSDFINDFIVFGQTEEYSENTIYRSIHFVKTILNFAEKKGIRTRVRELEIRREKQQKTVITLSEEEIIQIKSTQVPEALQPARDWLLISCYTGQRFSDFMKFNVEKITRIGGKPCISFTQQKTQKKILLPLHPMVVNTLQRNGNSFPKVMDIQQYNDAIKEIARMAGLDEPLKVRKRMGYRSREINTEKWKVISSHIGRRSFASNFYGKIPTPLLMQATGHSSEQMFLRYINTIDKERILSLSIYFDKVYTERNIRNKHSNLNLF